MKYKQYSPELWAAFHQSLEQAFAREARPVAAFDADGTLWDTDLGEGFFHHQIRHSLIPLPPEPWQHYLELKKKNDDPREAYLWLAQILKDIPLHRVREWATAAVETGGDLPIFPDQRKMIELLLSRGVEVYIVTASITWAVEPGARALGIPEEHVLGVATEVRDGLVTDVPAGVITYRTGKVESLLRATGGRRPFLAAGNTAGDLELLESATDFRLAVCSAAPDDRLFRPEGELQQIAAQRSWHRHRYV